MVVSRSEKAAVSAMHSAMECRYRARWLYITPLGRPVVAEV